MGSPLGALDPSHITNMVVDQAGLGVDHRAFAVPFSVPPGHRPYHPDNNMLLNFREGMDNQPQGAQASTPNQMHANSHMQHMQSGSPSLGQPVTPQQMMQQPPLTPGGQYPPEYQQTLHHSQQQHMHQQQQYQQIPQSPNHGSMQPHLAQGGVMGNEASPVYPRQMMPQQQQMMQQAPQPVPHGHMNPMMGNGQPMPYPQYPQQAQQQAPQPPQPQPPQQQPPQAPGQPPQPPPQAQQQQQWAQQQQQHQMQQQHYQRPQMMPQAQAGQRVMIQRVPYPPPAYMGGMQQQGAPAGAAPAYPGRPAPPNAPPQMARPAYTAPQPAGPQQLPAYPQGHPAYQQQQYPQQIYQRQQLAQPMRPYMSPQGPMAANHQAVYANTAQQPTTPQTPQPPYAATGNRFPQATASPHGHTPDLRSPNLMSPNQQVMQPMQQNIPPMNNPQMRLASVQPSPSSFYAHDPQIAANIGPDLCLAGCLFHILDVERYNTDKMDITNLALAIRLRGGDVDFGPKTFNEKLNVITHVIVDSVNHPGCHTALSKRKRVVTLQWLCDTLQKGIMEVPTRAAHLPYCVNDKPFIGKHISISGFDESERACLKWMIEACGARLTPYLCKANSVLIAKTLGVEKVEKAKEWSVPVVNYLWLSDYYMGLNRVDLENARYQVGQPCEVTCSPYALENMYEMAKQLLAPWKAPLMVQKEHWSRYIEIKKILDGDCNVFPNKRLRMPQHPAPSEEEVSRLEKERHEKNEFPKVFVTFAGVDEDIKDQLSRKLRFLGGKVVDTVSECTHLVAMQGSRSERFLEAIILGKNIVNAYWIVHGYECKQFMDTLDYFLRDEEMEKNLGYSCKRSVIRARTRPVFEAFTFYITPSVVPHRSILSRLIRLAGGKVDDERPDPAKLVKALETDTPFVVVGCESDLRVVQYLVDCGFPIFTSEFVLMSILRQEVEAHSLYRVSIPQPRLPAQMVRGPPSMRTPSAADTPQVQQQTTPQRVRT